ncbi:MAG TPA: DedA family protein [Mycobacteriales bacterium]|nr:DedA family protein [Mycobacteriales bacterium]
MHQELAVNLLSASSLISSFGTLGIAVILFAETGLLIGLFLPGDTLLFTAGVLTTTSAGSTVHLQLGWVLLAVAVGALAGSQAGFMLGRSAGPRWFTDRRPRIVMARAKTAEFIEHYGVRKAIVLSRFVPIVRTAMSPLLGSLEVKTATFTVWQVVSGLVWTIGITMAGWGVGSHVSNIDHYLLPIVAVVVAISLLPVGHEVWKNRRKRASSA